MPLLRDETTIGVFALTRDEANPFTDKQIELVTTFADQAVIAIENVRLFEVQARTRDANRSQYQTAISDVLNGYFPLAQPLRNPSSIRSFKRPPAFVRRRIFSVLQVARRQVYTCGREQR